MLNYLGAYIKFSFVIERKQNTLVLELKPKIEGDGKGGKNLVTIKIICYNYDECNKALAKIIILNELSFNFIAN
jgi:hypothetical protein